MSKLAIIPYQPEHISELKDIARVAYADPDRGWGQEGYDVAATVERFSNCGRQLLGSTLMDGALPVGAALATVVPHEQIVPFLFDETVTVSQGVEELGEAGKFALRESLERLVDMHIPGACTLFGEIFTKRGSGDRMDTVRLWKSIMQEATVKSDVTIGITRKSSPMDNMIKRSLAGGIKGEAFHDTNVMNFYAVPHNENPNLHFFVNAPDLLTNLLVRR